MNRIFRRIWSRALGAYVVASELAKSDGRRGRTCGKPALATLAFALSLCGGAWAQGTDADLPAQRSADEVARMVERYLQEREEGAAAGAGRAPVWFDAMTAPQWSMPGTVAPMGVIDPGGLTGGTLPGLLEFLNGFLLGNDYAACGLLGDGTLLPDECLTIARENFNYSFLGALNLITLPNVLDLNGNRPADHITIIGRAASGSYITLPNAHYNSSLNDPDCLLGVCAWNTLPAQNYQIIIGDGAAANGSNTVVLGTNASHVLPSVNAAELGWTGGPDGNYADRLGNAVVIGHGASGTADRQTILGANASSAHANSVALGAESVTVRGAQAGYAAPGLSPAQTSAGEVSIGAPGAQRQLTNVAAGSADTDAVNVAQLSGAISEVNAGGAFAVRYDDDGAGNPDYGSITLAGADGTVISNLAPGEVSATSDEAINGAQLFGASQSIADHLGGGATVNVDGSVGAPTYVIRGGSYHDVGAAFDAVDGALDGIGDAVDELDAFAVRYDDDGTGAPDYGRATLAGGADGTTLGNVAAGVADDEAVNAGQLSPVVEALGGGAQIDAATGAVTGPTYALDDGTDTGTTVNFDNVGSALENLDGRVATNTTDINNLYETGSKYFQANSTWGASQALGDNSVAIGPGTVANGFAGLAAGFDAVSSGTGALVVGWQASAQADAATAIGRQSQAYEAGSTAIGYWAQSFGGASVAVGQQSVAMGGSSAALGHWAQAMGGGSVALGAFSVAGAAGGVAVGLGSQADRPGMAGATELFSGVDVQSVQGAVSVGSAYDPDNPNATGERQITHVAGGTADTDAVNVRQLRAVEELVVDLDALAVKYDDDTFAGITLAGADGTVISNLAAGEVSATSDEAINGAQLFGVGSSVAEHLGGGATVNVDGSIGAPTYVIRGGSYHNVGDAFDAVDNAFDDLDGTVGELDAFALRYDDDGTGAPDYGRATLAGADGTTLGNVAAGVADDEAVNVGQLSPVVEALGGGAGIDPTTGAVTGPTYVLDDGTDTGTTVDFDNVGSALENLDGRVAANTTSITNILDGTAGLVRQDPDTLLVTVAGQTGGDEVGFANVDGDARRLSGVADGVDDTDAANMGQLREVEDQIGDLDALAVKYDDDTFGGITLAGADGTVIDNVAAGAIAAGSMQAINGGQLHASLSGIAEIFGGGAAVNLMGGLIPPSYAIQGAIYSNVGDALAALNQGLDDVNTRVDNLPPPGGGERDPLVAVDGVRDGSDDAAVTDDHRGVAIGSNASKGGRYGIAIGGDSHAAGDHDTAIGGNAQVHADNSTAVGANATVTAEASESVALGEGSFVSAASGTALGQGASVTAEGAVALGQGSVADRADTVSVGSAGSERQIVNVAAGTEDTDAVNVAQLRASEQGSVRYDTNPDGSVNNEQITLNRGGDAALVRNVRAGVSGTDAVNVNQLNAGIERAVGEANAYTDMRLGQMQSDIWEIDRGYRAGVASAMAVAGLPQAYMPGKSMVSAAVSGYEREAGLAVGITTISENGRWVYKFSGTTNTVNDVGFTMGAGLQW